MMLLYCESVSVFQSCALYTGSCHESLCLCEFDTSLRISLSSILNVAISDNQWNQALLPEIDGRLALHALENKEAGLLATHAQDSVCYSNYRTWFVNFIFKPCEFLLELDLKHDSVSRSFVRVKH
jgi:hypothetical protein